LAALEAGKCQQRVSGGVKGSHFRRDKGLPAASRLMAGHTTTAAARVATKGRVYSLPEPINPQATLPRRQQESQNWRAGCVGQEASVAANTRRLAVVGVVPCRHCDHRTAPCLCCKILRPLRQHQQLAQNGIIAQARATRKEKI
jgi:hypothetical protein